MEKKLHPIFSNTIFNIFNTAVSFIIAFAMTPVILGRLGNEDYGIWVFLAIFSISGYFSFLDLGFQGATTKYIAEFKSKNDNYNLREIINATLFFFLMAGIIGALIILVINSFFLEAFFNLPADKIPTIKMLITIIGASFLFQFPALGYAAIIQGLQRYDYLRGVTIVTSIFSNLVLLVFLKTESGLSFIVIVTIITSLIVTLLYYLITKKLLPDIKMNYFKFKKSSFKLLFSLSSKLFISKIVALIFNNTDKILIAIFLTVNNQTEYDIVNKINLGLISIISIVNRVILPASSEIYAQKDENRLKLLLFYGTKYTSAMILPILLILLIYPKQILGLWVGEEYLYLVPLIQLYISYFFISMLVGVSSTMFVGINQVGKVVKISIYAAIINLTFSILTVKPLGIQGLILATVIASYFSSILYIVYTNRILKIKLFTFFKQTIFPLCAPTLLIFVLLILSKFTFNNFNLIGFIIYSAVIYIIYFFAIYFTGLNKDEQNNFKQIIKLKGSIINNK